MYTADQIREETKGEFRSKCLKALEHYADVPAFLKKDPRFIEVWVSGAWLNNKLAELGFSEEDTRKVGFAHGQMSLYKNPYEVAARFLTMASTKPTSLPEPGEKLAEELCSEHMKKTSEGLEIRLESYK